MLNQEQVWSWCTTFIPPQGVVNWNGTACLLHEFGKDHFKDLSVLSAADVLVGMHGGSLFNAFHMKHRSSVVEIRPYQFNGTWPNMYMKVSCGAVDGGP